MIKERRCDERREERSKEERKEIRKMRSDEVNIFNFTCVAGGVSTSSCSGSPAASLLTLLNIRDRDMIT